MIKQLIVLAAILHTTACAGVHCAGRSIDEAYGDPKARALVKAAVRGDGREIESLVRKGANVNHLEDGGVPMLLWAICADNAAGFEALLKAGADPNLAGHGHGRGDGKGHGVKENGTIVREGWSATVMAAGSGRSDFLRLALQHGGDPNAWKGEREEDRPLLLAAYDGLFENIKILVAAGADVNIDVERSAPRLAIAVTGRYDIAIWLVEHGYTHDLQGLATTAEGRHVPLDSDRQRWKEQLIDMLRARGATFPASPLVKQGLKERDIAPEHVQDLIYGRRSVWDFPKRSAAK